jgi:hypothetical protein
MGRDGNGEISLQATWDQGGQILSQQGGFQVSKVDLERGAKGNQQGEKEQGNSATCLINLNVCIIIVCTCLNDCQLYVCR